MVQIHDFRWRLVSCPAAEAERVLTPNVGRFGLVCEPLRELDPGVDFDLGVDLGVDFGTGLGVAGAAATASEPVAARGDCALTLLNGPPPDADEADEAAADEAAPRCIKVLLNLCAGGGWVDAIRLSFSSFSSE